MKNALVSTEERDWEGIASRRKKHAKVHVSDTVQGIMGISGENCEQSQAPDITPTIPSCVPTLGREAHSGFFILPDR